MWKTRLSHVQKPRLLCSCQTLFFTLCFLLKARCCRAGAARERWDRRGHFGTRLFWKENGSAFSAPVFRALPADCCKFIAPCWGLTASLCDRSIQVEKRVSFSLEFRMSLQQLRFQQQVNFPLACSRFFSYFTFFTELPSSSRSVPSDAISLD